MRKLVIGLVLVLTACGGLGPAGSPPQNTTAPLDSRPEPTTTAPPTSQPAGGDVILRCDEIPLPTADPSLYRDSPKYVGNEMPTDAVRRWASQYPDFIDIWIDREHGGWVTAAFSGDVTDRLREIETEFADEGVVAVQVDWTEPGLDDLRRQIVEELEGVVEIQGSSTDAIRGYINLFLPVLTDENLAMISERFPDERICVEGREPEEVVPPGAQPQAGDGWRLLVDEKGVGFPFETGIAWDEDSLAALMGTIDGLGEVDIDVDFQNEVIVWFGAVYSGSCPNIRLDDVVVDSNTVYPVVVNTDNAFACTADANPHTYLVAVARVQLPEAPFYISIDSDPYSGRLLVEADLRQPGSTARPDQIQTDPDPPERPPDGSGTIIEPGYPWEYTVDLSCAFEAIGEINSYEWVATGSIPEAWLEVAQAEESVVVEVLLNEGPEPSLEVTFEDETVVYEPGDGLACPEG